MLPEQDESIVEKVKDIVSYHAPDEEGIAKISLIRNATANLLSTILHVCPPSADRSAAVRLAREAMMTANASIVLNGKNI